MVYVCIDLEYAVKVPILDPFLVSCLSFSIEELVHFKLLLQELGTRLTKARDHLVVCNVNSVQEVFDKIHNRM